MFIFYLSFRFKVIIKIILLLVCCGVLSNVSAQFSAFGFKFGLNRSSFNGELPILSEAEESYNYKSGYNLGMFVTYKLIYKFDLTAEVNYVMKGSRHQRITDSELLQKDVELNYLEIPLMAKFYFLNQGSFSPYILAGPSFNILISGTEDRHVMSLASPVVEDPIEYDIKDFHISDDYRATEISVVSGFGFQYPLREDILLNMNFRFAYGLTDIKKDLLLGNQMSFSGNMAVVFPF